MQWYLDVLRKYAEFGGRARRKEYWMFALVNIGITMALVLVDTLLFGADEDGTGLGLLSSLYTLAVLVPSLAVSVRRLHDSGRSGWWLLVGFIPFVGFFVLLFFLVQDSQPGVNRFGPNPKEAAPFGPPPIPATGAA